MKDGVEKTGNLLDDKGFRTNNEIKIDGLQLKLCGYEGLIANSQVDSSNGKFQIVFDSSEQAVDYILTKKQLGIELTGQDVSLLSQTLWQNPKQGQLASEFKGYALNNADEFKKLGININEKNVGVFVDRVVKNTCVINSIYENVVLSVATDRIESVPKSYGDMYFTAYSNKLLQKDGINLKGYVDDLNNIQNFANTISNGNFKISGATTYKNGITTDNTSYGLSTREVYNKIPSIIENSSSGASGGRIKVDGGGHNMTQFNTKVYDTGQPNNPNSPRTHGREYNKNIYKPNNTQSIWTLTPYE